MSLCELADALDAAKRHGPATDDPEGSRYVIVSDTLLTSIAQYLRLQAETLVPITALLPCKN